MLFRSGEGRSVSADAPLNAAQRTAVHNLAAAYGRVPSSVEKLDDLRAWMMLQGVRPGYGSEDLSAGMHAAYQPGQLSLPRGRAGQVRLIDVAPADLHTLLVDGSGLLRAKADAAQQLEQEGPTVAMDTRLAAQGFDYGHFIYELWGKGILELGRAADVKEQAGVFCVLKKDGKLRLIFDTRRSNMHFADPPHVELACGEALSAMEIEGSHRVAMSQGDVE